MHIRNVLMGKFPAILADSSPKMMGKLYLSSRSRCSFQELRDACSVFARADTRGKGQGESGNRNLRECLFLESTFLDILHIGLCTRMARFSRAVGLLMPEKALWRC